MKRYDYEYRAREDRYYVIDRQRGHSTAGAMARCDKAYDAERIVDALNAAEAPE